MVNSGVHVTRMPELVQLVSYRSQRAVLGIFKTGFYLESHHLSRQQINILELCFISLLTWQIRAGGRVEAVNQSFCQV